MSLRAEIENFTQPDGLISPRDINPTIDSTGNGVLYFSLYCLLMHKNYPHVDMSERIRDVIGKCFTVEEGPWLLHRSQTKAYKEQIAMDDLIGAMAMGYHLKSWVVDAIFHGLKETNWFYKNVRPDEFDLFSMDTWKSWFYRRPDFVLFAYEAMRLKAPIYIRLLGTLVIFIRLMLFSMNDSSFILNHLMISVKNQDLFWAKRLSILFKFKVNMTYGSMVNVLKKHFIYCHPLVNYWRDLF